MADKNQLLALLSRHIGEAAGITAEQITLAIGVPKRRVRTMVSELRLDGVAVCGHPRDGYYIASNSDEVERTCRFLRSRALHSLTLESKLRHVPLPDLLGQMRLKT